MKNQVNGVRTGQRNSGVELVKLIGVWLIRCT
jgi:hypothetical protein